jgi:GNAT superfamily N-acetyltransferase
MAPGRLEVAPAPLKEILPLRERYRREMNCQIVHDAIHERGWTDSYLVRLDGLVVGYGSAYGPQGRAPRDVIKEFYVVPEHRAHALLMFRRLAAAADAWKVEAQTNDVLLTLMLYDSAKEITSDTILFADAAQTNLSVPGAAFRMVTDADRARMFPHTVEPVGDWLIEVDGEIVATGGLMFHYNPPYGDIYMEVAPAARRNGYGSYLVQELKRTCRGTGRIPAARTGVANVASRKALEKAGLLPCARILRGIMSA